MSLVWIFRMGAHARVLGISPKSMGPYWFKGFCKFLNSEKYQTAVCVGLSNARRKAPQIAPISRGFS